MTEDILKFKALLIANEQRNAYGLRYSDYGRYRKHCANRTHRLRSSLKMTHGKGKEFKKLPPVKVENIKEGYLQLLLFEAERAWTYSRELSAQANNTANKANAAALKRSATSRFRRAVNWATQLLSHCQTLYSVGRLSAEGLIQVTVYTLILNGRFLSSRFDYDSALIQLSVARSLLDELAARAVTSRDQALATAFADEIGPEIRYCAHELGNTKAYDVDGIAAETSARHRDTIVEGYDTLLKKLAQETAGGGDAGRKKLKPVLWEGEPIPVRNPELVDVLLKVQEAEDKLSDLPAERQITESGAQDGGKRDRSGKGTRSKRGVAAYDAVLHALSDAEEVARKLVETQQLSGGSSAGSTGNRDINFLHAYIVYQLLARRIQRDLLLISTLLHQSQTSSHHPHNKTKAAGPSKPKKEHVDARLFPAVVKLLDTVIQSLTQMRTLSVVDDSPDLATAVDARVSFTKARRCRYLARCYTPVKKYAESLTLMQRGALHLREARSILSLLPASDTDPISAGAPAFYPLSLEEITKLEEDLSLDSLQCKKDWFAFNGGATGEEGEKGTHKKPLFFDIALNYVQLDMERLQERAGRQVEPPAVAAPQPTRPTKQPEPLAERKAAVASRAKVEEIERPQTPEPTDAAMRGGLSSLLGGWWGRR